jgi:hypothetical protein
MFLFFFPCPSLFLLSQAADAMINGYSGYIRFRVATKEAALIAWSNHCERNHSAICDQAPPLFWGIKYHEQLFNSRCVSVPSPKNESY